MAESYPKISPAAIYEKAAVVFPVLHGPMGEDGSIQGFLEILRLAYVGPNILSASSTMDKLLAKHVFEAVGVPQVPYVAAFADENQGEIAQEVVEKLEFPVFVKPANIAFVALYLPGTGIVIDSSKKLVSKVNFSLCSTNFVINKSSPGKPKRIIF